MQDSRPKARELDPLQGRLVAYFGASDGIKAGFIHGYLMVLNGLGEPVEYNWGGAERPRLFAWDRAALERAMARKLLVGLLDSMASSPALLLVSGDNVPTGVMGRELYVDGLPWARVSLGMLDGDVAFESPESLGGISITVSNQMPPESRGVLDAIIARGGVMEPFERGRRALAEVFGGGDAGGDDAERAA